MSMINPKDQKQVEQAMLYRRVFGTPDGQEVLTDMLRDLSYNSSVNSQNEATLHNYAKKLLYKMGVLQDCNEKAIVAGFFKFPYIPPVSSGDKE